jgi:hypothetical protein
VTEVQARTVVKVIADDQQRRTAVKMILPVTTDMTLGTTTDPVHGVDSVQRLLWGIRDHTLRPGLEMDIRNVYQVVEFKNLVSCG